MGDKDKSCINCVYTITKWNGDSKDKEVHCMNCSEYSMFSERASGMSCNLCVWYTKGYSEKPCNRCKDYSNFVRKQCSYCKYKVTEENEPCSYCDSSHNNFELEDTEVELTPKDIPVVTFVDDIGQQGTPASLKESITDTVNNFHFSLNPCGMCKYENNTENICNACCYYYASEFELRGNE